MEQKSSNIETINLDELKKHRFIKFFEFAINTKEFTWNEAKNSCNLSEKELKSFRDGDVIIRASNNSNNFCLSPEGLLDYLDFLELNQANVSAKKAKRLAIIAIFISALLAAFSILLSIYQMTKPSQVILETQQFEEIQNLIKTTKTLAVRVDSILGVQQKMIEKSDMTNNQIKTVETTN